MPLHSLRTPDIRGNALAIQGIEDSRARNALAGRQAGVAEQGNALAGRRLDLAERNQGLGEQKFSMESASAEQQEVMQGLAAIGSAFRALSEDQQIAQYPVLRSGVAKIAGGETSLPPDFGPEAALAIDTFINTMSPPSAPQSPRSSGRQVQELALRKAGRAPGTTVNVGNQGLDFGDPPNGFVWARNPDSSIALQTDPETGFSSPVAIPIAGGPAARKIETVEEKQTSQKRAGARKASNVLTSIGRLRSKVLDETFLAPVTGLSGSFLSNIRGTEAANAADIITSIEANLAFGELSEMRQNSPTGGAVGQLTDSEREALGAVFTLLKQSQSREEFLGNLDRLEVRFADTIHGFSLMSEEDLLNVDETKLDGPSTKAFIQAIDLVERINSGG